MWMSNIYIMIDPRNSDCNTLRDLCAAVSEAGATVMNIDEQAQMIEAAFSTREVPTIAAMEGVAYVRSIFNYLVQEKPLQAA